MTRTRDTCVLILLLLVLGGNGGASERPPEPVDLLVEGATVHDGSGEGPFLARVAVRDGSFVAVDRAGDATFDADESFDGTGLHLVPGLWDMHTHVRTSAEGRLDLEAFLDHGVTSIRDLGGLGDELRTLRAAVEAGEIQGPTIYTSLETLNGEAFAPFQRAVTTESEVKTAVAELAEAGADLIKIHRAFQPGLLPTLLEAAGEHGLHVTGHIPLGMSPMEACRSGMHGIEHLVALLEAYNSVTPDGSAAKAAAYMLSEEASPLYECLAERDVVVDPTVVFFPAVAAARSESGEISPAFVELIAAMKDVALRLYESDVTMVTGTDTNDTGLFEMPPGESLLEELSILQDAGIPPAVILRMATLNAARSLGVDDRTGTIEVGKDADFLLLSRDPSADIRHMSAPVSVYRHGQEVASGS